MELDNLKDLWRNLKEDDHQDDDDQIIKILQKKSQSPIAKMKRNLFLELIAVIILYAFPIWYFFETSGGMYIEISVLLSIAVLLFIFYFYKKNKLLGEMQCVTCEVRSNLQRQLITLEKYVWLYFVSGILLVPIAYFAPGLIVILKYPGRDVSAEFTNSTAYTIFITIGVLITIGSYFFSRWYIRKLYGQHINRLKDLLLQMEEKEPFS
jgi:uncharacterized protein YeeX (DUF496 family)